MSKNSCELIIYCDGASRGNPGPAAVGVQILSKSDNSVVEEISQALGVATNNEAEYRALIMGLEAARNQAAQRLEIFMDSELVVKQIKGLYKVKKEHLRPLYNQARSLLEQFEAWSINHVRRENNREADRLANAALDG